MNTESNDETARVIGAVKRTIKRLLSEGKDILAGNFIAHNGQVILTISNHSESEYSVTYACYDCMWNFLTLKSEVKP